MRVVCSALTLLLLAVLARRWVWQPLFSRRGAYVVYGVRHEGADVATLALTPGVPWPGAALRPVSSCGSGCTAGSSACRSTRSRSPPAPSSPTVSSLTVRATGDFTRALARLGPGQKVWLDGPHGSFTPDAPERVDGLVLIAGGVGITPMMSMLRTLAERGDRRLHRLVLAERPDQPLFGPELEVLARRLDLDVLRTAGRRVDADLLAENPARARGRLEYYVCGPPGCSPGRSRPSTSWASRRAVHASSSGGRGRCRRRSRRLGRRGRRGRRATRPRPPTSARPTPRSRSHGWRSGRRRRGAAESIEGAARPDLEQTLRTSKRRGEASTAPTPRRPVAA